MHSQIYSGLSLILTILRNFRVAGAKGFFCPRQANAVFFYPISKKKSLWDLFLGRKTMKIVHVLQKLIFHLVVNRKIILLLIVST